MPDFDNQEFWGISLEETKSEALYWMDKTIIHALCHGEYLPEPSSYFQYLHLRGMILTLLGGCYKVTEAQLKALEGAREKHRLEEHRQFLQWKEERRKEVDAFIESKSAADKAAADSFRKKMRNLLPDALEIMEKGKPVFQNEGRNLAWNVSCNSLYLYPDAETIENMSPSKFKDRIKVSASSIRIPLADGLPDELVEQIVRLQLL